jgi:hypothetical protein
VHYGTGQGSKQTVAGLLQSLGLAKYSLIFQAEEVDMAALQHMSDSDLKELGMPMVSWSSSLSPYSSRPCICLGFLLRYSGSSHFKPQDQALSRWELFLGVPQWEPHCSAGSNLLFSFVRSHKEW